jgi:phenylacetate-CoA ligase
VVPGGALDTQGRIQKAKEVRATALMNTPTYGLHLAEVAKEMGIDPRRDLEIKKMIRRANAEVPTRKSCG